MSSLSLFLFLCCSQFLMPGMIDTHIHAPQYRFTGTGYDKQLLDWLDTYTFPTESKFADVAVAHDVYPRVVVSVSIPSTFICMNCSVLSLHLQVSYLRQRSIYIYNYIYRQSICIHLSLYLFMCLFVPILLLAVCLSIQ